MRGLRTKLFTVRESSIFSFYKIINFAETWLTPAFCSLELGLGNFEVFSSYRNAHTSEFLRGGGVSISSKFKIKCLLKSVHNT